MVMFKWIKLLLLFELGWAQIHYLNEPLWTFTIRKTRIEKKSQFLIDNRKNLCEHGGLHNMTAQKGKCIPGNVYINMKETFIKIENLRVCWDLIQVNKSPISLTMIYKISIWDVKCVSRNCGMTYQEKVNRTFSHGLMRTVGKWWRTVFLVRSQLKKFLKLFYANNVHMSKKI